MWLFATGKKSGKPIRIFHYNQTRSKEVPKKYLEGFKGTLQTDAYQGYNQLGLNHIACWAHLRRYFTDALPRGETETQSLITLLTILNLAYIYSFHY